MISKYVTLRSGECNGRIISFLFFQPLLHSYLQYQMAATSSHTSASARIRVAGSQLQNCEVSSKNLGRTYDQQSLGDGSSLWWWIEAMYIYIGVSKNRGVSPQIILFNRVFHYFHHPFWGFSPYFRKHPYVLSFEEIVHPYVLSFEGIVRCCLEVFFSNMFLAKLGREVVRLVSIVQW